MDLRKEIQVALNSCEPNNNRVDKIEAIARKFADLHHSIQLMQPAVVESVCDDCIRKNLYIKKLCYCGYCGDRLKK